MTDHDLQHAANAKALADMHPGNRFRLMAGLPLLKDEVMTTKEEKFQQLPEWIREQFPKNPVIHASVTSWLSLNLPVSALIEGLAQAFMHQLDQAKLDLTEAISSGCAVAFANT